MRDALVQRLRRRLEARLRSDGGRPGLADATQRPKIPLTDEDVALLELLTERIRTDDLKPTSSQVCACLVREALESELGTAEVGIRSGVVAMVIMFCDELDAGGLVGRLLAKDLRDRLREVAGI